MKKALFFAGLAAAALTFVGCNKEADYAGNGRKVEIVLSDVATRTINYGMSTEWKSGDELSVFTAPTGTTNWSSNIEFTVQDMLVYVGGAVNYIGRHPYDPSWHAIDYVAASGINTISGTWNQIRVWRGKNPEALKLSVTEDQIMPGDYIEIPKSHYESFKDFTLFLASLLTVVSSAFIIYVNYNR